MTKYSDIEIQTAKNLLKEGYKWLTKNSVGTLYACKKITPVDDYTIVSNDFVPIFKNIESGYKSCIEPVSLEDIVHPQILDGAEKRYLSAVIKPFRDIVKYIAITSLCCDPSGRSYLYIRFTDGNYDMSFPVLHDSNMYKGMELDHAYSLEELGL